MSERLNPSVARPVVSHQAEITVRRVGVNLGAEISGIDLRQPLLDAQFEAISQALVDNELIVFRDQDITSEQLMAFGRRFGDLTVHPFAPNEGKNAPELIKFRNDRRLPHSGLTSGIPTRLSAPSPRWRRSSSPRKCPPSAATQCSSA